MYALGRLYFETGFFAPAERIFNGLVAVGSSETPSRLGLALLKLELGLFNEAATLFRQCLENHENEVRAKIGLSSCFIASGDTARAESLLKEVRKSQQEGAVSFNSEEQRLLEALVLRARQDSV